MKMLQGNFLLTFISQVVLYIQVNLGQLVPPGFLFRMIQKTSIEVDKYHGYFKGWMSFFSLNQMSKQSQKHKTLTHTTGLSCLTLSVLNLSPTTDSRGSIVLQCQYNALTA